MTDYPGIVFVSNKGNGTVVAIQPQTKQVLRTFAVGQGPTEMALTGVHIYVANSTGNSVSMINLDTNTVSAPIAVGNNPTGLAVSLNGTRVYVTNQGSNTVSVINATTTTNTVIASIPVGSQPSSVVISPDGSLAYVANSDDTVSVIDTATNVVVRTVSIDSNPEFGMHSMAMSQGYNYPYRDDDRIYVTDAADRTMRALALTPSPAPEIPSITTAIGVGSYPVNAAVVGDYVFVVNTGSSTVSKIDTTTNTVVGDPISVGSLATAVATAPAANRVYIADHYDNRVYAIDATTNTVVDAFDVPIAQIEYAEWWNGLTDVEVSRDGRRIFVVSSDNNITAIDTVTRAVIGRMTAGYDMEVSADGRLLYVTGGDAVGVYDTATWPESAKFIPAHTNTTTQARWSSAPTAPGPMWALTWSWSRPSSPTSTVKKCSGTRTTTCGGCSAGTTQCRYWTFPTPPAPRTTPRSQVSRLSGQHRT